MPQIYKFFTALLAFTGCISLIITGGMNPIMIITGAGLFPGYYRFLKGMPPAPKWAIGGFSVLTLIVFLFDSFILSDDTFLAVAHLTITFQAIKSFDLKEPWDHLQVYFMSLLQLIVASELTNSIVFGIIFLFFLVAFASAMVLSHFVKEGTMGKIPFRSPVFAISLLTLFFTCIFFVSLPRVSGKILGKSHVKSIKTAGFSERVDFGSFGDMKLDPTVVMRVELSKDTGRPYYWRGMTLDYFDGNSWVNTLEKSRLYKADGLFRVRPFTQEQAIVQKIFLEPMDNDVIFGMSDIAAVEAIGFSLNMDSAHALSLPFKNSKKFNYIVYSIREARPVTENVGKYLQMPASMERVSQLARTITDTDDTTGQKAQKIEQYLIRNFSYSLAVPQPPQDTSPIDDFLFGAKKGYCEHYATAMVFMLRALRIPSRIVTGFAGGEPNEYGQYLIIRQSNAHSWVEAEIDGVWKRFDPTPPVSEGTLSGFSLFIDMMRMNWERYVVAYSISDQREIARFIAFPFHEQGILQARRQWRTFLISVLFLTAGLILIRGIVHHLHVKRYGFITRFYLRLRDLIRKRGGTITPSSTPADVRREAIRSDLRGRVSEFIGMYEEYRFGGKSMTQEERTKYQELFTEIRKGTTPDNS
jgi:transglutaminase-like putative cysteine protease